MRKPSSFLLLLPLLSFLIIMMLFWCGLRLDPHLIPSTLINKPVPKFSLPTLENPSQHISNQYFEGKVFLLNVFASWCVICEQEHPVLMDIAEQYKIPIIGLDYKDDDVAAKKMLQTFGNPYQMVLTDHTGKNAIDWGIYGTPETFIIDSQGIIRAKQIGALTKADWQQELWPLIQRLKVQ